jgi:phage-related protein
MKAVSFVGSSLDDLRRFPKDAKHDIGQQIALIQSGVNPRHWRPMPNVGHGVREIRVRDAGKAYRSINTTTISDENR